jgi:copper chaperone
MGLFGSKERRKLKVGGMTCGHCVMRVKKALEEVEGVKKAEVNLEKGEAEVSFKGQPVDTTKLVKAVTDAGYRAEEA